MTPATIHSFNTPYLFDFFYSSHDVTRARPGYLIDAMLIEGGIVLWRGRRHLVVEIHALRALCRLISILRSQSSRTRAEIA